MENLKVYALVIALVFSLTLVVTAKAEIPICPPDCDLELGPPPPPGSFVPSPDPVGFKEWGTGVIRFKGHGAEFWWNELQKAKRKIARLEDRVFIARSIKADLAPKWRCIFNHEARTSGGWRANTGNGYFGGLQMNLSFQRTYGPRFFAHWGTADRWPVLAQLVAAERAWKVRGFQPWPTTSRICGLS